MSGSRTITKDDERLDNVHPGDVLRHDFLIGSEIPEDEVAKGAMIDLNELRNLLDGRVRVDAETDLRLARYFGMSEGFFMGLQADYDIEEAKRAKGEEFDRIVPRAA